jgi:membrane-associated phospholipid phosphatase
MSILNINDLSLELVAMDFSDGHMPNNAGPTKTSRALAIIHLAAHDAFAQVTGKFAARLPGLPILPASITPGAGSIALLGAGFRAATLLYPDFAAFIAAKAAIEAAKFSSPDDLVAYQYGERVAEAWIAARMGDGSGAVQTDTLYNPGPGRHRPDPLAPAQPALGRRWGLVTPFVLTSVPADAPLAPPPALNSPDYAVAFNQVIKDGKNDIIEREPGKGITGIFWGYDGANKIGVPPRIYNQVVREIAEFKALPPHQQVRVLTAINVAMADAGIAAWYWKYQYDFWRPVVGIREADAGWGPTGAGDGNSGTTGDPFWLPLGAPKSNPFPEPKFGAAGSNFTPNFPAYPSGHSTFGSACFEVAATLLSEVLPGKTPDNITIKFVSDEFNGKTTDNSGVARPRIEETFTLREAINENAISRIYLGVHWIFDATGGEDVGIAIANKVSAAFPLS